MGLDAASGQRRSERQVEELEITEYREDVQLSGRVRDWKLAPFLTLFKFYFPK